MHSFVASTSKWETGSNFFFCITSTSFKNIRSFLTDFKYGSGENNFEPNVLCSIGGWKQSLKKLFSGLVLVHVIAVWNQLQNCGRNCLHVGEFIFNGLPMNILVTQSLAKEFKGYLRYKTIFCNKVTLDV